MPWTAAFTTLGLAFALFSAAGCAGGQPPYTPTDKDFGSRSEGGLLLFAAQGQYEIWKVTDQYGVPPVFTALGAGDIGAERRLVGLSVGRRHVTTLAQHANGQLSLHRMSGGTLDAAPIALSRQPSAQGFRALSFSLYLRNPKFCLQGESDHLLLLERPAAGGFLDEVWQVSDSGLVRQQMSFARPPGWLPMAVGVGAVESPDPWILFARPNGLEAKLVQMRASTSGNELLPGTEVPLTPLGTPSTGRPAATGFTFASTVRDHVEHPGHSYLYWWWIYKWRQSAPTHTVFVASPEPGGGGFPVARPRLQLLTGDSPEGLDLVAYADRRPACIKWNSMPRPDRLSRQEELWQAYDGALQQRRSLKPAP